MLLSFTGMAQTVGQLRYDTVKMYKVGGSTELIIQNTTKDSTGGIFTNIGNGWGKWLKPYAISGGIVIGLDTVLVSGGGTTTEDTLLLGRGIAKDSLAPYKNSIYLDSSIYKVTQLNDSTLEFAHYDGRLDTVVIAGSGGGGGATPTLQQVLTAGSSLTTNNTITSATGNLLTIKTNGVGTSRESKFRLDTLYSDLRYTSSTGDVANVTLNASNGAQIGFASGTAGANITSTVSTAKAYATDATNVNTLTVHANTDGVEISSDLGAYKMPRTTPTTGYVLTSISGATLGWAAAGGTPAGNYGNLQVNRNSVFSTPASDSLTFSSATLAVKGALTTTGAITATGNVSGNLGLFTGGVRTGNNTNFYWNSGPVILGNTNDITLKNAAATAGANVSIGTSAAVASSILDVNSTTKGALLPRMTGSEAEAISSPATGLIIYCTNGNGSVIKSVGLWNYNGTAWVTAGAKEYTVYRATLTQTGTSAPTITLLENTTGSTVTAQYDGLGEYSLQFTGTPLTANKTFITMGSVYALSTNLPGLIYRRTSTSSVYINTYDSSVGNDNGMLGETAIEIRIYP